MLCYAMLIVDAVNQKIITHLDLTYVTTIMIYPSPCGGQRSRLGINVQGTDPMSLTAVFPNILMINTFHHDPEK